MEFNTGSILKLLLPQRGPLHPIYMGVVIVAGNSSGFYHIRLYHGICSSWSRRKLSSNVGLKGIAKRYLYLRWWRLPTLWTRPSDRNYQGCHYIFYLANELLSIIENSGRIGLPVPPMIIQAVEILKGKGEAHEVKRE